MCLISEYLSGFKNLDVTHHENPNEEERRKHARLSYTLHNV